MSKEQGPVFDESSSGEDDKEEEPDCEQTFYDKSRTYYSNRFSYENDIDETLLSTGLDLSERFVDACYCKEIKMYNEMLDISEGLERCEKSPEIYKHCRIEIFNSHRAVCTTLDGEVEIEISGRSKCGRAFNEDEVVVEILNGLFTPYNHSKNKIYGKVVCITNRKETIPKHPVFVCSIDDRFMIPVCKTVPKIYPLSERDERSRKRVVEVYKFDEDTKELIIDEVKSIDQSRRKEYIFLVCVIKWKGVFPLGAIIKVHDPDYNVETCLNLICLENKVSVLYKQKTINKVNEIERESDISLEEKREDLTDLQVFTIDNRGSKDLDDALSIKKNADSEFEVGVHIADVGSIVRKDDDIDLEAQERSSTFNPGEKYRAYHMFPEPIATGLCSLLPFHKRKTLSVFFVIDKSGKIKEERTEVKRTYIKSKRSFTYQEVQTLLSENDSSDDAFYNTLSMLYDISKKMRFKRLGLRMFSFPYEQRFTESCDEYNKSLDARTMVEEYMIYANCFIAKLLRRKFPDCVPLRTQDEPSSWKMNSWIKNYPVFANFVLSLQHQNLPVNKVLSIDSVHEDDLSHQIPVQKYIWEKMNSELKSENYKYVQRLIGTDEFHPQQAMAYESWIAFQKTAVYNCSGLCHRDGKHFSLGINPYVHFTSPIRRYADLVVHRLVHAYLDKKLSPYSQEEIDELCKKINSRRNLEFERQCRLLHLGRRLQKQPQLFHGLVVSATEKSLFVCFPGLRALSKSCNEIEFRLLKVKSKPLFGGNCQTDPLLILSWLQRLYSLRKCSPATSVPKSGSVKLNPHLKVNFISLGRWKEFINSMIDDNLRSLKKNIDHVEDLPIVEDCRETHLDASSENRNGIIVQQCTEFSLSFNRGQVIPLQLGAEQKGGLVLPTIHLLEISKNVKCCIQHMSDPVECFAAYATRHAGNRKNVEPDEYVEVWSKIFRMESITSASKSLSVIINDLPIKFCCSERGFFVLQKKFCLERDLDFQWEKAEKDGEFVPFERNFLCIRCEILNERPFGDGFHFSPNNRWIWVGHGETKFIQKNKRNSEVKVHFQLHRKSRKPTFSMMEDKTCICSIEILQMSVSDRRIELNLKKLDKATKLARSIALREKMPELDYPHLRLGKLEDHNRFKEVLQQNNDEQSTAINKALSSRFTLIHGPPGTGKTSIGIKLILLFVNINSEYRKNGGDHKQVVYCAPSNKSVDLVARRLHLEVRSKTVCPDMVRMYGSSVENTVYPIPGRDYINQTSSRVIRPDQELADVSLHNLIREDNKPYARELKQLDKLFQQNPEDIDPEKIIEYMKILSKATQEELKHHDVIFCTTSVATNPKLLKATQGKVFQLIIDEAGMCTEPETIAPIIATEAEQVVLIGDQRQLQPIIICPEAGRLGLSRSLFERHSDNAVRLTSQYRMNPKICEFPSKQFYKGELNTKSSEKWKAEKPLSLWKRPDIPLLFCHVQGEEECLAVATEEGNQQSRSNMAEVDHVVKVYTFLMKQEKLETATVRVLSQYNAQRSAINEALKKKGFESAEVNTVVSSQGGEWDYVIFSTVRSLPDYRIEEHPTIGWCLQNLGFITDRHQINVALTRARKGIIIIGNQKLLKCDVVWMELLNHYRRQCCIVDSKELDQMLTRPT